MTVLLGLLAAASAGTSDFLGGLASRKAAAIAITTASHLAGFLVALVLSWVVAGSLAGTDMAWGALGGIGGAAGLLSIYLGYAKARVSIVAPIAGVGAAALPVIADAVGGGDDLSTSSIVGVALGLVAIALVSIGRSDHDGPLSTSLFYGLGGAAGLGLLLLCFAQTSEDGGMWPLVSARGAGFLVVLSVMIVTRTELSVPQAVLRHIAAIALLGTGANALFIGASRAGSTAVAAVLTSMFPAVTVLLAFIVLRERLRPVQLAGLGVALLAVALIAMG